MDKLVANLIEAYRRSITELDWMTEETKDQRSGQAREVPPAHRLPDQVARLLRLEIARDDLIGNVHAGRRLRGEPLVEEDRRSRSTAKNG